MLKPIVVLITILLLAISLVCIACSSPSVDDLKSGKGTIVYANSACVVVLELNDVRQTLINFEQAYNVKILNWSFSDGSDRAPGYLNISW